MTAESKEISAATLRIAELKANSKSQGASQIKQKPGVVLQFQPKVDTDSVDLSYAQRRRDRVNKLIELNNLISDLNVKNPASEAYLPLTGEDDIQGTLTDLSRTIRDAGKTDGNSLAEIHSLDPSRVADLLKD